MTGLPEKYKSRPQTEEFEVMCLADFASMCRIVYGKQAKDFFQLPPVRQSKPLCVYDPTRLDHWRDDFKKITLTAIMRQKDDVAFAELLNRLRVKEKSDELSEMDRALLATRWMAITLRCWNCFIRTLCRLTRMTTRKTKELAEWQDWRRS
ncbi:uncharacterized protein ACBT44_004642 [Syngnathus typhle]